jgi:pyruvate/2-oxoglutarate/acetoin dehydrogenase E1 component
VSVEIVDPRTLVPLDEELIVNSVGKTGRAIVVVQAPGRGSFGEHILRVVQDRAFHSLKGPVKLVSAHEVPPPMSAPLEHENLPSAEKIARNIREMLS